jgi:hypothetical protein
MNTPEKLRGLSTVRVSKEFLLGKLRENRVIHEKSYYEILEARQKKILEDLEALRPKFEEQLKERLDKSAEDAEYTPTTISLSVYSLKPENHTKDYDKVITLLDASLDAEFELSSSEFNQYVNDDWEWKTGFITVSGCYMPPIDKYLLTK